MLLLFAEMSPMFLCCFGFFMKKIFLFIVSLFLFAVFSTKPSQAESIVPAGVEHVDSDSVVMNINADTTVSVTESIDYDFGDNTKTGITRYIPLNYQDLSGTNYSISVTDLSVLDENGNSYIFKQSRFQGDDKKKAYLKVEIGDETQPITGAKIYVIHYIISDAIKFLTDHDELYWDITGDKWPVYVGHPEIKINLPQRVDRDSVPKECFIGLRMATIQCIDRINNRKDPDAYYSYKGVVAGESMMTIMGFPKGVVQKKTTQPGSVANTLATDQRKQGIVLVTIAVLVAFIIFTKIYFKKIKTFFSGKKWVEKFAVFREKMKFTHAHHIHKIKNKNRKWWITLGVISFIFLISGCATLWKVKNTMNKISVKGASLGNIVQASFDSQGPLKGESDGQINVLLMGVLGANHPGGGLNTDTIMVASIKPKENKISLVSVPRDLWVTDPGKNTKSKINAVYAYGEEKGMGQGIADMESLVSDITGLPIHYAAVVSTKGFSQLVDTLGGVDVDLAKPFDESSQFEDINVCDSDTYTIPTGEFKERTKKGKVVAKYPLCKNKNPECGGNFSLPVGKNTLTGEQALCFVRSRYQTSDFERAKRQQLLLQQIKLKVAQIGLLDFGKINSILNNLGDNVRTDMQLPEMRRLLDLYKGMNNPKIYQKVLEDSKEGLLYSPDATPETGFILLPRGDNYDKIKDLFQHVFDSKNQSDIKPKI